MSRGFICVLDASGEQGVYGDPCESLNACDRASAASKWSTSQITASQYGPGFCGGVALCVLCQRSTESRERSLDLALATREAAQDASASLSRRVRPPGIAEARACGTASSVWLIRHVELVESVPLGLLGRPVGVPTSEPETRRRPLAGPARVLK